VTALPQNCRLRVTRLTYGVKSPRGAVRSVRCPYPPNEVSMSATIRKTLMASAITALLVAGNAGATVLVTDGLDGLWDEPGNTSRGLAIDALPNGDGSGVLVGALYTYENDGSDSWLLFNAPIALGDNASAAVPVLRFNGGEFGGAGQAAANETVGTAVVTLNSCSSMSVEFSMTDAAY